VGGRAPWSLHSNRSFDTPPPAIWQTIKNYSSTSPTSPSRWVSHPRFFQFAPWSGAAVPPVPAIGAGGRHGAVCEHLRRVRA